MISLVIPTYNERENIESLLTRTFLILRAAGHPFEVLVVDDDSPDGTWVVVERLAERDSALKLVRRYGRRSLAQSVLQGWREAKGEILAVMDGDLQHPPETLTKIINEFNDTKIDVVVASRNVAGGGTRRWSLVLDN